MAVLPSSFKRGLQSSLSSFFFFPLTPGKSDSTKELSSLAQENRALKEELAKYKAEYTHEKWLARQIQFLKDLRNRDLDSPEWRSFFERRAQNLTKRLEMHLHGMGANVILREPNFWSSHLWIDRGATQGVTKNSPVVIGNCLIGLVDEVEKDRSKVRLITDIQLTPAVRVVRGEQGARYLMDLSDQFLEILRAKRGLLGTPETEQMAMKTIEALKTSTMRVWGDHYLAKGEISGSSFPLWRSRSPLLKGKGFNYDFPDSEGHARDLRGSLADVPLLLPGDLLLTSGLDGVFPEGLEVGIVSKVHLLREGDYSYDLEAIPCFTHLDELREVWVLLR